MLRLQHVEVRGLFGYMAHDIDLRNDGPTILTGPNGAGKTHVLRLLKYLLGLDLPGLMSSPFQSLKLCFTDSHELLVSRDLDPTGDVVVLQFNVERSGRQQERPAVVTSEDLPDVEDIPAFISTLDDGRYYDARSDVVLTSTQLERRYGVQHRPSGAEVLKEYPILLALTSSFQPMMIDTKRLDRIDSPTRSRLSDGRRSRDRINEYIDAIRRSITLARRESIQATQSADLSFAARALAVAKLTVKETELHERYDAVVKQYEHLAVNGMAIGERPLPFPDKTTPTVRRILKVFLDDWENRLVPLVPVGTRIQMLRDILDSKLAQSYKATAMGRPQGRLTFRTIDGRTVSVSKLSSGEQHLIALFTLLLFSTQEGSLVLIDEPELSMHAAWKHQFISDIARVAHLARLQIIIATHSTAIINGRWDLTEELSFSPAPEMLEEELGDLELDSEEFPGE